MNITIIGTGHVLKKSVSEVKETIERERPDIVALELDENRFHALIDKFYNKNRQEGGSWVGGGSLPVFGNLIIGKILESIQKEFGEKLGVFPGQEMIQAIESVKIVGSRIVLIDRDLQITLNRLISTPLREKFNLLKLRRRDENLGSVEDLLDENVIERLMIELKKATPTMYNALVDERDKIMALSLYRIQQENPNAKIVAVVGAGHKNGIFRYLGFLEKGNEFYIENYKKMKKIKAANVLVFAAILIFAFIFLQFNFLIRKR